MSDVSDEVAWQARAALHRYCRAIDNHDSAALTAAFTEDVVLLVGGGSAGGGQTFTGRDTVVPLLASLFPQRRWARHSVTNELVDEVSGDDIEITSYFHYLVAKEATRVLGTGDYRAVLRRDGGRLLIRELSATIVDEVEIDRQASPV